jgi:hypothetical protein
MDKVTFEFLRPALLIKMFELGDGILLSDETNVNRKQEIESFKPFAATLTEQQYKLFMDYEQASNRAWTSDQEDHFIRGMIEGIRTAIGLDPSVILRLIQTDKAVPDDSAATH